MATDRVENAAASVIRNLEMMSEFERKRFFELLADRFCRYCGQDMKDVRVCYCQDDE